MRHVTLSPCQDNALIEFIDHMDGDDTYFVLTGGPGRGKSFLTKQMIEQVEVRFPKMKVYCTATTNKAAAVLSESIERDADTVYKLFGLRVKNDFATGRQYISKTPKTTVIHNSLIVIDEISMADDDILKVIDDHTIGCKVLLVGDADQLAPVFLTDCPAFNKGHVTYELDTVMRQKAGSPIIALANQLRETVRTGVFKPLRDFEDGNVIRFAGGAEFKEIVEDDFSCNYHQLNHGKIICWTNDKVNAYNAHIRSLHTSSETFEIDELVVTNIPVFEGDSTVLNTDQTAVITNVRKGCEHEVEGHWYELDNMVEVFQADSQEAVKALLKLLANKAKSSGRGGWAEYFKMKEFFGDLRSVHACTAYKSQGSTYGTSYIDLDDIGRCRQWEQVARMLYVAITRAKGRIVFYGELPMKYTNGVMKYS